MLEDPQSSPSATATPAATAEPSANIPSAHPTPNESASSKAGRYISMLSLKLLYIHASKNPSYWVI